MSFKFYNLRLLPGSDLKKELVSFATQNNLKASSILTGIGSLNRLCLRKADQGQLLQAEECFEILSIQGTLSLHGVHLHMSVADNSGKVAGGHLMEGCQIFTTAEITLLEQQDVEFFREKDLKTGYLELVIRPRSKD